MFLRKTSRFKDGKRHDYWSVAENARAGARVVQRQLLYLGEIDEDRQNAWLNAIDELEERKAEDAASYLIPPQPEPKRETRASGISWGLPAAWWTRSGRSSSGRSGRRSRTAFA